MAAAIGPSSAGRARAIRRPGYACRPCSRLSRVSAAATSWHGTGILAAEAARFLAEELGTETAGPPEMHEAMASIRLPVAAGIGSTDRIQWELGERFPVDTSIVPFADGIGVRISAHVYNEFGDYERLLGYLRDYFGL